MNPADLHQLFTLLMQLPIVGGVLLGIWYADRRNQQRGERVGALEDRVTKLEAKHEHTAALEASRQRG